MAVRGSIQGRAELRSVQAKLVLEAPAQLRRDLLTGTRDALKPIKADVSAETLKKLPRRHGYAPLVAKAVRVETRVTSGKSTVNASVLVSAFGKREARDLVALNQGMLRHPLFGNRGRWYLQRIRRGLIDDPIDRARDRVVDNMQEALDAYADTILRG